MTCVSDVTSAKQARVLHHIHARLSLNLMIITPGTDLGIFLWEGTKIPLSKTITQTRQSQDNVTVLCQEEKHVPRKVREAIYIRKELSPTLNRDGGANCQDLMILYWQHLVVLGHHQYPEVDDQTSVNTQLPPADDGEQFL